LKKKYSHIEEKLVKKLQKGSIDAFEELYEVYSLRLYHFGMKYLRSKIEAEGLVQDVFAKVWEKRSSLKPELSFKSYIFTISFNLIRKNFITKSKLREYLCSKQGHSEVDLDTVNQVEHQSLVDYLNTLVIQLPERRREVFIKSRLEDMPVKKIATQMGISTKTVENQLTAATKFIKANWLNDDLPALLFFGLLIP